MSRSRKKTPIVKMKGWLKEKYHGIIRRHTNMALKEMELSDRPDEIDIPSPQDIIGDWEYNDYAVYWEDERAYRK